jgi:phosphoserine aminotransferase
MSRIHNFSAGPAVLPEPVLKEAQAALWDLNGSGIGVAEHSHRGKVFDAVLQETVADCRKLAGIPDNYHVLFLQGGASLQFAMVPMNLLPKDRTADFLVTGAWSQKAVSEAKLFGKTHEAASSKDKNFNYIPKTAKYSDHPAYVHFT